ncbi:uncharacterized protein LOC143438200 [Arvicanthis niloticus]|uniref:uncharacterized protein LOC143310389 n=1 Tax=Arvicanthis niloticus TaxID=61156 RepID=UPI00402B89AB
MWKCRITSPVHSQKDHSLRCSPSARAHRALSSKSCQSRRADRHHRTGAGDTDVSLLTSFGLSQMGLKFLLGAIWSGCAGRRLYPAFCFCSTLSTGCHPPGDVKRENAECWTDGSGAKSTGSSGRQPSPGVISIFRSTWFLMRMVTI